jgi:4-hydroxy-3-methylbut-2-enyl diphosphate reductase
LLVGVDAGAFLSRPNISLGQQDTTSRMFEQKPGLDVYLCAPRGFCAGVSRAVETVELALKTYGAPIYVRHHIVHNRHVIQSLQAKGAIFVEELSEIPDNQARVIFSAHGVPTAVESEATRRGMFIVDASCPLVKKVHREAEAYYKLGYEVVLIGHRGHPEVIGFLGQLPAGAITLIVDVAAAKSFSPRSGIKLAYVTQTTLSIYDVAEIVRILEQRFPTITGPRKSDVCYATTNRQSAVKMIAPLVDAIIVIGSPASSNSQRLREVASSEGCARTLLIEDVSQLDWTLLDRTFRLGLTAGASVPELLVERLLDALAERFSLTVETVTTASEDGISFALPKALLTYARGGGAR